MYRGEQYRLALHTFKASSADGSGPDSLDQLLEDKRSGKPVRHLRRLYSDPISRGPWKLQIVGGKINGVYSASTENPLINIENVHTFREMIFQ